MVRIMIQRLQCNVFMLSYRGYVPAMFLSSGFVAYEQFNLGKPIYIDLLNANGH